MDEIDNPKVLKPKTKRIFGSQTTGAGYSFYLLVFFVGFFARRAEPQEKIELCLMVLWFDELLIK